MGRGGSRIALTGGWPGVLSEESFMQFCGCTPWDENVCGAEAGNHKGCPYNGFVGVYFRSNRSCRLPPAPISMKMGTVRRTGNHKGCPYDGFAGAYFRSNDREMGLNCSWKSVLPTPVSPSRERGFSRLDLSERDTNRGGGVSGRGGRRPGGRPSSSRRSRSFPRPCPRRRPAT